MVVQKQNFISDYERDFLLSEIDNNIKDLEFGPEPFYHWINIGVNNPKLSTLFYRQLIQKQIDFLNETVEVRNWEIDYIGFAYQTKGFDYHADSVWPENPDSRSLGTPDHHHDNFSHYDGTWVDNYCPWRVFTTVLYLNDDIVGGETHFPTLDILVTPKSKKIVGFHCDESHVHGVMPVTSGYRKAFIMWFK